MQCKCFSLWKYLYTNSSVLQLLLEHFLIMYIAVYLVPNILSRQVCGVVGGRKWQERDLLTVETPNP